MWWGCVLAKASALGASDSTSRRSLSTWTARAATDGGPSRPCGGSVTYDRRGLPADPTVGGGAAPNPPPAAAAGEAARAGFLQPPPGPREGPLGWAAPGAPS